MIGTLLTHEFQRTWKPALALMGGAIVISGLGSLTAYLVHSPVGVVCGVLGIVVGVALPLLAMLGLGIDFYRSTYSRNGYLTAALPIRGSVIYWVKLAYAYVVGLIALLVGVGLAILGFATVSSAVNDVPIGQFWEAFGMAVTALDSLPLWIRIVLVLVVLLIPLTSLAQYWFAVTVGGEAGINKLGLGGVVLMWFAYYIASQIIGVIALMVPPYVVLTDPMHPTFSTEPFLIFNGTGSSDALPLVAIIAIYVIPIVAIWWGKVSYDRRLELR